MISTTILIGKNAEQQIAKVPSYIRDKLYQWVERVEEYGIYETRKIKSYHDEPLSGKRVGQRSVRLNRSFRAIYTQNIEQELILLIVIEVTNHEY